jgi:hypothetical protein
MAPVKLSPFNGLMGDELLYFMLYSVLLAVVLTTGVGLYVVLRDW